MTTYVYLIFLLCGGVCKSGVAGQTYDNARQLKTTLLTNYDASLVPKNNQTESLGLTISLTLYSILEVDIISGTLSTLAGVLSQWTDELMVWNASDYGGILSTKFTSDLVWTPSISMSNTLKFEEVGDKWMRVVYSSSGKANWNPVHDFKSSCSINVRYWPFDKQICYMSFFMYGDTPDEVLPQTNQSGVVLTYFSPNSEWDLEETFVYVDIYPGIAVVNYGLKIKRQSMFYVLTIVLPLMALNLMNSLVFLIPTEFGDRIGYTVTILLSITVFLLLIGDHVPKTSDPLPLICGYMITIIVIAMLCLVTAILNLSMYFREDDVPEASWGRRLVSLIRHRRCRTTPLDNEARNIMVQSKDSMNGRIGSESRAGFRNKVDHLDDKDLSHLKTSIVGTEDNEDPVTWKDVSKALDKVFFVLFLMATVIPSLIIPVYLAASSAYPSTSH